MHSLVGELGGEKTQVGPWLLEPAVLDVDTAEAVNREARDTRDVVSGRAHNDIKRMLDTVHGTQPSAGKALDRGSNQVALSGVSIRLVAGPLTLFSQSASM